MKKVLFICTHNSARSQMAEGLLSSMYGDRFEAYSAGTKPTRVNPYAIEVMQETGIDISSHRAKGLKEFSDMVFDVVVTVCNNAKETCPFIPGAKLYLHKGFRNPSTFQGSDEEQRALFRGLREEIKDWVERIFATDEMSDVPFTYSITSGPK